MVRSVVIGTAGHIDHGKTALIRALTGIDTDRLPEEKRRGITVDLGFASSKMRTAEGRDLTLSFIDVPGHSNFVRNMVAGSGGIDCVILVISAQEGVKPQTEEHLAICEMLGVKWGLVALTKVDCVTDDQLHELRARVRTFVSGSFLREAPIVTVSARTGLGIPVLREALAELAKQIDPRPSSSWPRLPIDRVFVMKGFGTVVTGTLQAGTIKRGDELELQPSGQRARVRGLHVHNQQEDVVQAGSRVALNLGGVDVEHIARGDTVVLPSTYGATRVLDVEIVLLHCSPVLQNRSLVKVHCFASEVSGRISLYEANALGAGETGLARIRLHKPMVVLPGDRFVLRQPSPAETIGGGRIVDCHPLAHSSKSNRREWINAMKYSSLEEQVILRIQRRRADPMSLHALLKESGIGAEEANATLAVLTKREMIVDLGAGCYVSTRDVESGLTCLMRELQNAAKTLEEPDLKRSELKQRSRLHDRLFDFLIGHLTKEKRLEINGERVRLFGLRPVITSAEQKQLRGIADAFKKAGLAPPSSLELAASLKIAEPEVCRQLSVLVRDKVLTKTGGFYFHCDVLKDLYGKVRALKGQAVDVNTFKRLTGLSRKYAIPLLEHLDREHITRREGETRIVT